MALEVFDFSRIATIDDGRVGTAFNALLKRCEDDCRDRPALSKPRTVTLQVTLSPVIDEAGDCESVNVGFHLKDAMPKRESKNYNMTAGRGGLLFNDLSPEDARQATFDMINTAGPKAVADAR